MESITLPFRALFDPVGAVPLAVAARRWFIPVLLVSALTAFSGAAIAMRLDAARLVIPKLQMTGELAKASEREIGEQIDQAQRVALVVGVAKGVLLMPLLILLLGVALKIIAWLIGRKVLFIEAFTVAALTMLPVALFHGIELAVALKQSVLTPSMLEALVPTSLAAVSTPQSPKLAGVFQALDFINLWAAVMMGLGFAAASKWQLWKGAAFGLFLYVLFACVFFIGLPALTAGMKGP